MSVKENNCERRVYSSLGLCDSFLLQKKGIYDFTDGFAPRNWVVCEPGNGTSFGNVENKDGSTGILLSMVSNDEKYPAKICNTLCLLCDIVLSIIITERILGNPADDQTITGIISVNGETIYQETVTGSNPPNTNTVIINLKKGDLLCIEAKGVRGGGSVVINGSLGGLTAKYDDKCCIEGAIMYPDLKALVKTVG